MNLLEKKEIKEYLEFRKLIFSGPLYILKNEYIHILYKLYITILRYIFKFIIQHPEKKTEATDIFTFKKDFIFLSMYSKELEYLENVFKGNFDNDSLRKDQKLVKILGFDYKIIVSPYAHDVLLTYIERLNLSFLHNKIINKDQSKLMVSKNLITESYTKNGYIQDANTIEHIQRINTSNYILGMLRDNYNYLIKLEEIIKKRANPNQKGFEVELENKFPIEKSSSTFLSNCPEYKNKFLIDLAKNYINRKKIDEESPASILKVELHDPD